MAVQNTISIEVIPTILSESELQIIYLTIICNQENYCGCWQTTCNWWGRGGGQGILEIFCEKSHGPPTSQIVLMHGPSQIP